MPVASRWMLMAVMLVSCVVLSACDGRTCDEDKRSVCTAKVSRCVTEKCGDKQGDAYNTCFEVLCLPDLCQCLDEVGCAWQETSCDNVM